MKQKRSDLLREAIEEKIAMGEFPPGTRLDEAELLAEFGVSRTPLREALIQLDSQGLVEIRPRRGAVVANVSAQQLIEMFEVMGELEAMCGRLAARRISDSEQRALLAAHKACQEASEAHSPDAYYYANEKFHFAIYAASHNAYLAEQARQLHRKLRVYRRLQLRVRDRVSNSFAEHDEVVQAILAGNGDLTAERLRKHVLIQGERFGDLIASLAELAA
jgi:DNA-binding GntR family transcriptional regulator